jgi:hypothetical protein
MTRIWGWEPGGPIQGQKKACSSLHILVVAWFTSCPMLATRSWSPSMSPLKMIRAFLYSTGRLRRVYLQNKKRQYCIQDSVQYITVSYCTLYATKIFKLIVRCIPFQHTRANLWLFANTNRAFWHRSQNLYAIFFPKSPQHFSYSMLLALIGNRNRIHNSAICLNKADVSLGIIE